jgi:enolase-phosphatase E1
VSGVPSLRGIRAVLLDIEGTTTPIAFVYDTLFPYARAHLREFLETHASLPDYAPLVERLRRERAAEPEAPRDSLVRYLEWLMDRDRKSTALKELQGLIWEEGYRRGALKGEVFADVPPALRTWRDAGVDAAIFSSGSILAQRLLFRHSSAGDLSGLLRWHFDTTTGSKTADDSYRRIVSAIDAAPASVLFVSDAVGELDAARTAGLQTALAVRPGNAPVPGPVAHQQIRTFAELTVDTRSAGL